MEPECDDDVWNHRRCKGYRGPHRDDKARRKTPWVLQAIRIRRGR